MIHYTLVRCDKVGIVVQFDIFYQEFLRVQCLVHCHSLSTNPGPFELI